MPPIDAKLILAILGLLSLVLAAWRWVCEGKLLARGHTWLRVGLIFSVVAAWLWWSS